LTPQHLKGLVWR